MHFSDFLDKVDATLWQRFKEYGDPNTSFGEIAALWSIILKKKITPKQVALMMICLKMIRLLENENHQDSVIDIAGYAALLQGLRP
jgi:hypothetical protein